MSTRSAFSPEISRDSTEKYRQVQLQSSFFHRDRRQWRRCVLLGRLRNGEANRIVLESEAVRVLGTREAGAAAMPRQRRLFGTLVAERAIETHGLAEQCSLSARAAT